MAESQSSEEEVKNIILKKGEARPHGGSVVPFPFNNDCPTLVFIGTETKAKLKEPRTPLVGFSGEVSYPIGTIDLNVTIGEPGKLRTVTMEFTIVKSHSPYNIILGRTGLRSLGAVASTIHSMIKFPTANGIATMTTKRETLQECRMMEEAQGPALEGRTILSWMQTPELEGTTIKDKEESRGQTDKTRESDEFMQPSPIPSEKDTQGNEKGKEKDELLEKLPKGKPSEKVTIHDDHPDQTIRIGRNLTTECMSGLIKILRRHNDAFAWSPADMTGIPRFVAEHKLRLYSHIEPRV
ncbi:hypothetical protein Tco_1442856 [Tanacetum coccineum]